MTSPPKIAAIIVVYDPPPTLARLIAVITPQVDWVVVIDNAQNPPSEGVIWLQNPENGLAKAQNIGIEKARKLGASHVLLLDDDSLPAAGMVSQLLTFNRNKTGGQQADPALSMSAANSPSRRPVGRSGDKTNNRGQQADPALSMSEANSPSRRPVGRSGDKTIIIPFLEEPELGQPPKYIQQGGLLGFRRVGFGQEAVLPNLYFGAASGSLIPLALIDEIGPMREDFFIYFIDTEFCLRAKAAGFDVVAVKAARLTHRIGQRSSHSLLGRQISTTNHPAKARYYMMRNRKQLWAEYGLTFPGYVLFDITRALSEILRVTLFEADKTTKLQAMLKGLFS